VKLELLKSAFLGSLVVGSLAVGSLKASTDGINSNTTDHKNIMSSTQFYDLVKQTEPNQVASNFGKPDEMITLKNATGQAEGVVWVYHKAVLAQKSLHDARFVLINGEMKYVTLSGAA
jgi:hypothetical protein